MRNYQHSAPWELPQSAEVHRPAEIPALGPAPSGGFVVAAGYVLAGLLLTAVLTGLSGLVLLLFDAWRLLPHVLGTVVVLVWPGVVLLTFRSWAHGQIIQQVITPAEPAEIIRFIRLSTDELVDPRDLAFFLQRIEVTGRLGKNSIRGIRFPSGKRGSDTYHDELVQALEDAGLWEPSSGPGISPRLKVSPKEALDILGLSDS